MIKIQFKAHPGQKHILSNRARFNTANTGRQAGKTTLAKYLILEDVNRLLQKKTGLPKPSNLKQGEK